MAQLLNSELVLYASLGEGATLGANGAGDKLPLLNVAGFPEPESEDNRNSRPLKRGTWDAGGNPSYGEIEASVVYDPNTMEILKAYCQANQGGSLPGVCAFHAAPGLIPSLTPIKGETYDIVLKLCWLSDGQNSDGDATTMLNFTFGVQGMGR